jgi:branched-chain amino acid transport system ATP-binding protein
MTQFALEGIGLTRRFGGFVALDSVDIALKRGEIRGLIGPNGAGKSTLIDVLSGRAKNRRGRVVLNGEDVSELNPQQRRKRGMARSFQRTNIFPELTVEQQLRVASWAVADADIAEVMNWPIFGRATSATAISAGLISPWPWSDGRKSCCSTSRPPA